MTACRERWRAGQAHNLCHPGSIPGPATRPLPPSWECRRRCLRKRAHLAGWYLRRRRHGPPPYLLGVDFGVPGAVVHIDPEKVAEWLRQKAGSAGPWPQDAKPFDLVPDPKENEPT